MPYSEQQIRIPMPGGTEADAFLLIPDGVSVATCPGVIDLPDIRGIRDATLADSRRLADRGYVVLSPNPFYRSARPPVFDFPVNFAEQRTQRRYAELTDPLTPEAMHADAHAYVQALEQSGAQTGKIGVLGHCFTGAQALRTAAALPDRVAAMASFHGGHLVTGQDDPASPHRELPEVQAALLFAHAGNDNFMPEDRIRMLDAALAAWGGTFESEVFSARHGWTVPDSAAYDPNQAERANEKLVALFQSHLR